MQKITIKNLVDFRRRTGKSKASLAQALKKGKETTEGEGGGDYWVTSLSALSNAYKTGNLRFIVEKKSDLEGKYNNTRIDQTKNMYKRNIAILSNYEDYDLKKIKPEVVDKFLSKPKIDSMLNVKGFNMQATPHHVFKIKTGDKEEVGAVWFVVKLEGYKKDELGMFTDILYRYLRKRFPKNHCKQSILRCRRCHSDEHCKIIHNWRRRRFRNF